MPSAPVRLLAAVYFLAGLGFMLALYAAGDSSISAAWGERIGIAALVLVPLALVAGGYAVGSKSALWLLGAAWLGWVGADIVYGVATQPDCGIDPCKPPSLLVLVAFPWAFLVMGAFVGVGVMLRRGLKAGLLALGGVAALIGVIWLGVTDNSDSVHYVRTVPAPAHETGAAIPADARPTGPTRTSSAGVSAVVRQRALASSTDRVLCAPGSGNGLGLWTCTVSQADGSVRSAQVAVSKSGRYSGFYLDSRSVRHRFAGCCIAVK